MRTPAAWMPICVIGVVAHCLLVTRASAMVIVIHPDATLAGNANALAAFNRAGSAWSSAFTNDITIHIDAGLTTFSNPQIIGHTDSVIFQSNFDFFRDKIVASAALDGPGDNIVASLPNLANFNATLPNGFTFSNKFSATKANFKALGYQNLDDMYGQTDSTITFNSQLAFDYDNSNGVSANTVDFQSVAAHEIGHALGFISGVDFVDVRKHDGTSGAVNITPLDLFRFNSGNRPTSANEFTSFARFLDTGGSAVFDDTAALEAAVSTGMYTGDGRQASHWKDDALTGQLLGVMDPTMTLGVAESISANDVRALDLIGYNTSPVPEPGIAVSLIVICLINPRGKRGTALGPEFDRESRFLALAPQKCTISPRNSRQFAR